MNERIRELLIKAGFTNAYTDPKEGFELVFVDEEHTTESVAKFAELIVGECANAIINDSRLNDVRSAANGCVRTINEHFGVEK